VTLMFDPLDRVRNVQRRAARRRARHTLQRLGRNAYRLRRDLGDVRADVYRGLFVKEARRLTDSMTGALPMVERRRGRTRALPFVAVAGAGVAVVAGLLLWDDRRRMAMRRRLEDVTASVGRNANRAVEPVASGARSD
jgi:hypothetical protein